MNEDSDCIYPDQAKAFDKVDDRLLLMKPQSERYEPSLEIIKINWVIPNISQTNGTHSDMGAIISRCASRNSPRANTVHIFV